MTLVWEDFAYYDNSNFTLDILKGRNYPTPIWQGQGRFFPLGYQEFNLLRHFTDTITGYHVLPIAQLLIFSWILLILDDELSIAARVALTILALVTPSILISFSGLIFPEHNVLFFLACLVLSVRRFEQTKSIAWAVAAVVCAQIILYYKEPAFLLLLGFAAVRLMLWLRNAQNARWDYARLWDAESSLDLCFVSLAVTFLLYYFAVMGIHQKLHYARRSSATTGRNLARLHKVGFPSLAVNVRCARQDWSDPARPGGGVPVVGRTGFWWRTLRPCLLLPWHLQCLVLGTGRPHRSAVCRSACGSVVEKEGLME